MTMSIPSLCQKRRDGEDGPPVCDIGSSHDGDLEHQVLC